MKHTTILPLAVVCMLAGTAAVAAEKEPAAGEHSCCAKKPEATQYSDQSVYQLESVWTNDSAEKVKLGALKGKPQVVAMFFLNCQYTCPIILNDMRRIAEAIPENLRANVGLTLVSFDSERDTPEALHKARQERGLTGPNWTLLRGEPEDVRELAALLGINYRKDAAGNFLHSNAITVLNSEGEIVYQQPGLNLPPDEIVARLKKLF